MRGFGLTNIPGHRYAAPNGADAPVLHVATDITPLAGRGVQAPLWMTTIAPLGAAYW